VSSAVGAAAGGRRFEFVLKSGVEYFVNGKCTYRCVLCVLCALCEVCCALCVLCCVLCVLCAVCAVCFV
jgi:hypothetical protein